MIELITSGEEFLIIDKLQRAYFKDKIEAGFANFKFNFGDSVFLL